MYAFQMKSHLAFAYTFFFLRQECYTVFKLHKASLTYVAVFPYFYWYGRRKHFVLFDGEGKR